MYWYEYCNYGEKMLNEDDHVRSTRERVMYTLLTQRQSTINELAEAVNINPISVRHHISRLEADGLVNSAEEKHGVGRPRRIYYLTENGRELFPSRYIQLTLRILEQLKETVPQHVIDQLFTQIAEDLASEHDLQLAGMSTEQRLDLIKNLLTGEGFSVEWEKQGDHYLIREIYCPYYHVGQNHPEVCSVDRILISTVLSVPAEKVNCILNGDAHCTYIVPDIAQLDNEYEQLN